MTRIRVVVCLLIIAVASAAFAQTPAPAKNGSVEKVSVRGAALQGNLEGDSPDRDVSWTATIGRSRIV